MSKSPTAFSLATSPEASRLPLEHLVLQGSFEVVGGHKLSCRLIVFPRQGGFRVRTLGEKWSPVFPHMEEAIQHGAELALGALTSTARH